MTLRLTRLCLTAFVAGAMLAPPAAYAFTFEGGSGSGQVPKFDIEEQARNFRRGELDTSTGAKVYEMPGGGRLQFGVQQGPMIGPGFGGSGLSDRKHLDRMFAPPHLQENYYNR